jgi:TrmH family RNA methyltransferase
MLRLPIHEAVRFVLSRPHYPENVGAVARAIKTMGFDQLYLVKPGRIAQPTHVMARKMAVKSLDVLDAARSLPNVEAALEGVSCVFATTARRGVSGVISPREAAARALERAARGERLAFLFGNEKTGLAAGELERGDERVRIPMAADQPSINLAQAAQIVAYELFVGALARRLT